MAVATLEQMVVDVKKVLPIYDTDSYDEQLKIVVGGAIHKLEIEGVANTFEYDSIAYYDYLTCIRYQVAMDLDLDIDINRLREQYLARVNTLRCMLNQSAI